MVATVVEARHRNSRSGNSLHGAVPYFGSCTVFLELLSIRDR